MFVNLKNNKVVVHEDAADVLLYGLRVGDTFPLDEYAAKYGRRMIEETDDADAAPAAYTNFVWAGSPHERLTWRVLKSIWMTERIECPNCDMPLCMTSLTWNQGRLSFRPARLHRHCLRCRRRFDANEEKPLAWMASVLPPALRPTHLEQWRRFEIDWTRLAFKHHRPVQLVD